MAAEALCAALGCTDCGMCVTNHAYVVAPYGLQQAHARTFGRLNASSWPQQLQAWHPRGHGRVGLWNEDGEEVLWVRDGRFGKSVPTRTSLHGKIRLEIVFDDLAFNWATASRRNVKTADDTVVQLQALSDQPRIFLARSLLRPEECAALRRLAEPLMERSVSGERSLAGKMSSRSSSSSFAWSWLRDMIFGSHRAHHEQRPPSLLPTKLRTSSSTFLTFGEVSDVDFRGGWLRPGVMADERAQVKNAWARMASLLRLSPMDAEPLHIVSYDVGQHYGYHLDSRDAGSSPNLPASFPMRGATVLFYLSDGFGGGQTNFPFVGKRQTVQDPREVWRRYNICSTTQGLSLRPRVGDAVVFYNTKLVANGRGQLAVRRDFWPWHASCDVIRGKKWAGV